MRLRFIFDYFWHTGRWNPHSLWKAELMVGPERNAINETRQFAQNCDITSCSLGTLLSRLTTRKLYHLRQTPLALHRHETRENTIAMLMLCKVVLDGEIWNTKRSNLFFLSNSLAFLHFRRHWEISFLTVERIVLQKVFQIRRTCDPRHREYTNEKCSFSLFLQRKRIEDVRKRRN